jgi:hypothetical protein
MYDLISKCIVKQSNLAITDIRELIYENLLKYKNIIDALNFKDIYHEVSLFW